MVEVAVEAEVREIAVVSVEAGVEAEVKGEASEEEIEVDSVEGVTEEDFEEETEGVDVVDEKQEGELLQPCLCMLVLISIKYRRRPCHWQYL